jgi:hypothetical protein
MLAVAAYARIVARRDRFQRGLIGPENESLDHIPGFSVFGMQNSDTDNRGPVQGRGTIVKNKSAHDVPF